MSHPEQQDVYAAEARSHQAEFVPTSARSVLEVGCGRGGFSTTLRSVLGPQARLVGLEPVPTAAAVARETGEFDEVLEGFFPDVAPEEKFDLIVFNDVLEHMIDPWGALRACHDLLTPDGRVMASLPSIQYAPVVWQLVKGRWDYTDTGTLDRTHVRFFTRATMVEMFEQEGYAVEICAGVMSVRRRWDTDPFLPRKLAKRLLARSIGDAQYLQFILVGRRD